MIRIKKGEFEVEVHGTRDFVEQKTMELLDTLERSEPRINM